MKKKFLMRCGSGLLLGVMMLIINLSGTKETQAAAYEFWGKPAVIKCMTVIPDYIQASASISYNGAAVVGEGSMKVNVKGVVGTETTCNGFTIRYCGGTNCVPEQII